MLDVARMQRRVIGVQSQVAILQLDDQLDRAVSAPAPRNPPARARNAAIRLPPSPVRSRIYASVKKQGMSLPATVRVKLSSEAAEGISITRVVVQELPVRDLVEHMLGITGKNELRIRELLLRGTLVSGASRFRWTGWEADLTALRELLSTFPGDDPARAFAAGQCVRAVLRGGRQIVHVPREAGARKPVVEDAVEDAAEDAQAELLGFADGDRRGGRDPLRPLFL